MVYYCYAAIPSPILCSLKFSVYSLSSLQVVIPDSNTGEEVVVASLTEGNYFGEISLLRLDAGKNRLTKRIHFKWHKLCPTTICCWLTFSIHEIGISTFFFEHLDALLMCAQWVTQNCCVSLKRT